MTNAVNLERTSRSTIACRSRIVTVHIADESGGKTYVADGITRLDAMEALGWQIVDEHGNWIGALDGKVDHRPNYTHEQVAKLVISLNAKRRHQSKQELVDAIDKALKAAEEPAAGVSNKDYEKLPSKRGRLGEGRPKDPHKAKVVEQAADIGIPKATVEAALAKKRKRLEPRKGKSKLLNGKDASTAFDPKAFGDLVWKRLSQLIKRFDIKRHKDVQLEVVTLLLCRYDSKGQTIAPVSVTYPDQTTATIRDVIYGKKGGAA